MFFGSFLKDYFMILGIIFAMPHRQLKMLLMGLVTQSGNTKTQVCSLVVFSLGICYIHLQQRRKDEITPFKQ